MLAEVATGLISVTCRYAERTLVWPVGTRLYLTWMCCDDPDRRGAGPIPAGVAFQTKLQIAPAPINDARMLNGSQTCVVADAVNGENPKLLNGLEAPASAAW